MNPWATLVIGILIGWIIEWIIDWVYWRRKANAADAAQAACQQQVRRLQGDLSAYPDQISILKEEKQQLQFELQGKDAQIADLQAQLQDAQMKSRDNLLSISGVEPTMAQRMYQAGLLTYADVGALRPARLKEILGEPAGDSAREIEIIKQARIAAGSLSKPDDLEVIVGIGPVIARILNAACIFTFADLAALTVDELRAIVGEKIQRLADEDDILAQARELAAKQG
jgi:predicted flap endonuclease-1-like 5' DNA nuclease